MRPALGFLLLLITAPALKAGEPEELTFSILVSGLNDATSLYASSAGNLFLAETGRNRILKLSSEGERLDSLGRLGSGDYQFDRPLDVDATNELKIYIADYNNRRIQVYDRRFQYLSTVELPRRIYRDRTYSPVMLRVNHRGQLFFYDEDSRYIHKLNSSGQYEQRFDIDGEYIPSDITSRGDELYFPDQHHNIIHFVSSNGTYLGFFATPSRTRKLTVHNDELWTLADDEIIIYSRRGQIIARYHLADVPDARDIAIFRNQMFLLSGDAVYAADIQQRF